MNAPNPSAPDSRLVAPAPPVAFAMALARRYVTPPLVLSCVVSTAAMTSFLSFAVPFDGVLGEALNPLLDRFLGNAFSTAIVVVFLSAAIYAALQGLGATMERDRLCLLDAPSRAASASGFPLLLALISGRSARPEDVASGDREITIDDDPYAMEDRYGSQRRRFVDRGLAPLRYVVWVLPLLGFIGTVVGISDSIAGLGSVIGSDGGGQATAGLLRVLGGLRFAFDTTLLGLAAVIPVMACLTILERLEDSLTGLGRERVRVLLTAAPQTGAGVDQATAGRTPQRLAAGDGGPET